jgi:hypothetical protein
MKTAIAILLTFLFPSLLFAGKPDMEKQRRPITANLENVDPTTAARILNKAAKLKVEFAPQAAAMRANLRLIGVPEATAMKSVAEAFGCELRFLGKRHWHVAPAWQFAILDKLAPKSDKSLKIAKMPIDQLLDLIRAETKVDITLDHEVSRELTVTIKARKLPYRTLLDRLVKQHKLNWKMRYGVVYIATPARLEQMPVLPPSFTIPKLRELQIPVDFKRVPVKALAKALEKSGGVRFIVPKELAAREVSGQATKVSFAQALALTLYPRGMTAIEKDGSVQVEALPKK